MSLQSAVVRTLILVSCGNLVVLLAATGCAPQEVPAQAAAPTIERLTIITPHNAKIRQTFELGFSDWCRATRKTEVQIDWIVLGTPQCIDYVERTMAGIDDGKKRQMPDVMFGGGIADHRRLAERDYSRKLDLTADLAAVPAELNGLPTYDEGGHWFATGLSSFGIFYNQQDCTQRGIRAPQTWADLADPHYRGWLAVADPGASGSNRQAFMLILQSQGWNEGWATIMRILANARTLLPASGEALDEVDRGVFLAGFAVNFDGLSRAVESDGRLAYTNPPQATAVTPDVTSALKSPGDAELARSFIQYCLSDAGQMAWGMKSEFTDNAFATLYHYPIKPALYKEHADQLAVAENPFETDFGVQLDLGKAAQQSEILIPLIEAACGKNHVLLQNAWEAVIAANLPAEAVSALCAPPLDENAAMQVVEALRSAPPDEVAKMKLDWAQMFAKRYQDVLAMCAG